MKLTLADVLAGRHLPDEPAKPAVLRLSPEQFNKSACPPLLSRALTRAVEGQPMPLPASLAQRLPPPLL